MKGADNMNDELRDMAMETRDLYRVGAITQAEAKRRLAPYIEYFNKRSEEIAKKYNQKTKKFNFSAFMR